MVSLLSYDKYISASCPLKFIFPGNFPVGEIMEYSVGTDDTVR